MIMADHCRTVSLIPEPRQRGHPGYDQCSVQVLANGFQSGGSMIKQRLEEKFAQIQAQRREAHAVRREAEQKRRNQQTDQQILLLMQTDERLASLLTQAADSMCALLPSSPDLPGDDLLPSGASRGAKAFENRAQQWFSLLSEVQYSLRTAVRHLRDAQLAPLTAPVGPEARQLGRAGSIGRGHSMSLLDAFVDMSGIDGKTFKLPPATSSPDSISTTRVPLTPLPESQLSLQALRERERNWKELSRSLEEVTLSSAKGARSGSGSTSALLSPSAASDLAVIDAIVKGETDKLLIDALVNTNSLV
ncbi:hypothetical protein BCV70DRAFT_227092 [Testicularia cyperi]|uniref:Mediator of RNA polymerase II transcription subunit 11 n=1 Tax=Testicularia cyperi TaxID=1882483 RepID=A0A317XPQ8_9BASI|nr:hypothetical protein BCV70DRAFT_227092 [Testicularia cyperi]